MEELKTSPEQEKKTRPNILSVVIIILLGIILVLLICNLSATGYLIYKSQQTIGGGTASTDEPLPAELNSAQGKAALFEKFREPFNNKDDDNLYALLDPLAQADLTREKFDQQIPLLYQVAGKINSGVYSHYEYKGISRGRKWFVLYYRIQTDKGTLTLNITTAQADQEPYTVWGYHIDTQ